MKWFCEVVRDYDGTYYVNMTNEKGAVKGLPEYVSYKELIKGIFNVTGISFVQCKSLKFKQIHRKQYALVNAVCYHPDGACIEYTPENVKMLMEAMK